MTVFCNRDTLTNIGISAIYHTKMDTYTPTYSFFLSEISNYFEVK